MEYSKFDEKAKPPVQKLHSNSTFTSPTFHSDVDCRDSAHLISSRDCVVSHICMSGAMPRTAH
jgi:hypothetical protein